MPKQLVGTGSSFFDKLEPRVLLDASLAPPVIFEGNDPVITAAAGDFDGDGFQDLAVASYGPVGRRLAFLKGNGDGTFESPRFSRYTHQISQLVAADFDGDGRDELVLSGRSANGLRSRLARIEFNDDAQKLRVVSARPVPGVIDTISVARSADGPTHVLCEFYPSVPSNVGRTYEVLSIAFNDPALPIVDSPIQLVGTEWRGMRVTDFDGDGLDDIVYTQQAPPDQVPAGFTVHVAVQSSDPLLAGTFLSPIPLLTDLGYARRSTLIEDVDLDGHPDAVMIVEDDLRLYRGDGAGGFQPAEVLFSAPNVFSGHNSIEILGFRDGPTGQPELQVFHWHFTDGRDPPTGYQTLLRYVPQDDGSLVEHSAFQRAYFGLFTADRFVMAQFTGDTFADVVWLSNRHREQVQLFTFNGEPRPPLVTDVVVRPLSRPFQQTITTGETLVFRAKVNDPEKLLGEPGGIRRVRFYLDTNNNGMIDAGDVLASTKRGRLTVQAHWPRGTFSILAEAIDATGFASEVACGERTLTIL